MRALSISTLYPSAAQPNFGRFVELSLAAADATGEVDLVRVSPNGLPPWPLSSLLGRYRAKARLPISDQWGHAPVLRPRFRVIPGSAPMRNAAAVAKAVLPLAREMHAEKPFDLIDAQFFWPDGPAAMQVADALGLPFCIKARGSDIHFWPGVGGCGSQIVEAAQNAAGLIAVSEALKCDMAALGMNPDKIFVHRTGLDRSLFHIAQHPDLVRQALPIPRDGRLIVCIGTLISYKGQALLLEALPALPSARLVVIGEGPDRAALEQQAARLHVQDRVHFTGSISHAEIAQYLQAADLVVLPSEREGLANVWIEALACGTALVVPNIGSAAEVVNNDSAGLIVSRDADEIARAAQLLLDNPLPRERVAATVADYSWETNGRTLVDFWRTLKKG